MNMIPMSIAISDGVHGGKVDYGTRRISARTVAECTRSMPFKPIIHGQLGGYPMTGFYVHRTVAPSLKLMRLANFHCNAAPAC
jgi:hypothetical protein